MKEEVVSYIPKSWRVCECVQGIRAVLGEARSHKGDG